uniref:J domain-containing protein n=1 Tax=Timema monikensis TaxID=170555 RepID=A0A7R9HL42_9NEOP|nr:unnamed protein product [Timema monikensis]
MIPLKDNQDVACFLVTKHSWKGKYKRIFSVGSAGITTYNPASWDVTNKWMYSDFINILPSVKVVGQQNNEFTITMKKDRKVDSMRFSSEHRAQLLTEALRFRSLFAEKPKEILRYHAYKHHWSDTRLPVMLEVTACSLDQLDPATNVILASYNYKDIEGMAEVKDYPGGFVIVAGGFGRMHLFTSPNSSEIRQKMLESACTFVGIGIKVLKEPITEIEFASQRLGKFSGDEHVTSVSEFTIHKISPRHKDPARRTLCLTETCLLERDPQTYTVCTLRPLADIFALVRSRENPQLFVVEYISGETRTYMATDRDSLLASLLDGVRASGNRDVHVKMTMTPKGKRLGPLGCPLEEETESSHLKFFQFPPLKRSFSEVVERFNANIPYSGLLYSVTQDGLFAENKEKLITGALQSLVQKEGDQTSITLPELEGQFHALRRLVASKIGFSAFTAMPGFRESVGKKVVKALKRDNDGVTHAAIDMVCALMHPMHDNYDLRQEQLNKSSLLSTNKFLESLLDMWIGLVSHGTGALVVSAMLDFLTFALCVPYSETTDGKHFDTLLEMVADRGRSLFRLFQHPSLAVVKGAGLVMRAVIEEGEVEVSARMQDLALAEGALPRHLLTALFTQGLDGRLLTHRQLSRHLVGLWVTGHPTTMGLLKRIMPSGLLSYLDSEEAVPSSDLEQERLNTRDNLKMAQDHASKNRKGPQWVAIERQLRVVEKHVEHALQHWGSRMGLERRDDKVRERPVVLRKRRERIKSEANWPLFYYKFNKDHTLANLIWNHKTREELREGLENEIRAFNSDRDLSGNALIAWNHHEFEVQYQCLADEVCIGEYYLRLLLEKEDSLDSPIRRSYEFFNDLYHRFLLTMKPEMKCMCLQAMSIVYDRHHDDIGPFSDTKYIVGMLERCTDRMERDRLVQFIFKLILHRRNVKDIMDANGVRILVDLLTLAHLHTSRAVIPTQSNVIEAGPNMVRESEKEWHYGNSGERKGPVSFQEMRDLWASGALTLKTKCWAQGMDGWRTLQQVPQLKWCLLAKGTPVVNESDLATLVLNTLNAMCKYFPSRDPDDAIIRPLPRVKRLLSDSVCLPHLVQLLLTFDPVLVEKVATLLCEVLKDNPAVSTIYLTGVFYFILMYTGSNVLPIARFLQLTHTKQALKGTDTSDIMQRSVLGQLLPEAMVNYLENHGAEKFAQIYLGEFDTPEAIWNHEMRRMLIEKLAAHIAEFSPRLRSNTRALYQYCAIPVVRYPQLEQELFCNIFYLRHLCDTTRFPDWPINEPVKLLKDVLDAWTKEVEKKPPAMSIDDAYEDLNLRRGMQHEEATVRKAYYRLAQQFHPDKNPEGREKFEKVSHAYEFLCSRNLWTSQGPNPDNIVLILRTQSILFHRYSEELQPYKYAGYPQLIKTIQLETEDDQLFSKSAPLLAAASELAYHTVHCSALNAEELRREKGLDVLLDAYSRCVSVLSASSKPIEVGVQVCMHVTRCYSVAAQFQGCRDKMVEMPQLVKDLCHILYFKHLTRLCLVATECVSSLAVDSILQMQLLQAGCLWHLLLFMFSYDFTLEEGGVQRSEDANQQEVANRLAKLAVRACGRLGGYLTGDLESPNNPVAQDALNSLLTPYLARQLSLDKPEEILKILNSNCETPYLLWDNSTRAELSEYLEQQRHDKLFGETDPTYGTDFVYSIHSKELIVGGIFVRIYNEQPAYPIENAKGFTIDLLEFLASQSELLSGMSSVTLSTADNKQLQNIVMCLEALRNVIKNNAGVEMQCIGHFRLLFALLSAESCKDVQRGALEVIATVTRNHECVNDIAASDILVHLVVVLYTLPDHQVTILDILYALMSTTKIVKEALAKGALIYLLDLFCNSSAPAVREKTAELLARMGADKLVGPKVRLALGRFLPAAFADAMRDSPQICVHMFEGTHENPELIWDNDARERVSSAITHLREEHYMAQRQNPQMIWRPPDDNVLAKCGAPGELVVGGVYLRLFVANPGWVLRRPKEFLSELLDTCLNLMSKDKPDVDLLELATSALVSLLQAQPALADQVPSLGHIPRLCRQMVSSKQHSDVPKAAILVLHQLATSEALEADMVPYLLGLLEGRLETLENPATTKAQIVKALKAMSRSLLLGDKVTAILEKSSVWAEYKDQRHDLFITGTPATAGYLTQGTTKTLPDAPPPMDREDPMVRTDII